MKTDWFKFWSDTTPDNTAIIHYESGKSYSYKQINRTANFLVQFLQDSYNIGHGDRVCIISENRIEYIHLFAAAQKAGFILVPLNYRLTRHELEQLIEDADPALILYESKYAENLPDPKDIALLRIDGLPVDSESFWRKPQRLKDIRPDDPIFILYTSGSTGIPKGVLYTHKMMLWNSLNTSISLGLNAKSRTLVCMPPFHTGGWNVLLTPILHHGGCCILMTKFDPKSVLYNLSQHKCNQFMGVPTMLRMLYEEPEFQSIDLTALKYILVGGEPMPIELIKKYEQKGILIRQGFGMTEVGPNITSLNERDALRKIGSIGKPNMYVDLCLKDPDGKTVGANTRGELCFRGAIVTPAYWNNPEASQDCKKDGWLHSGDVAIRDDAGYYYIVDRIKNMYISGGENVYPAEVERVLSGHPGIEAVAIVAVPDSKWGEAGMAFMESKSALKPAADSLIEFCRAQLSRFKIPKHYLFIDELPKNAAGKIDRRALREIARKHIQS